ncbi:MAG: hypothetical protein OXH07_07580 [Chloroflexi bacterium]|nr:hypothetical protein [Chloroflexota bacterium]
MERHERIEEPAGPALPEDFAARLGRLEDLSGLSLEEFARSAGLPESRARAWRAGAEPSGEEMWALACWADALPGGWDVFAEQVLLLPGGAPDEELGATAPFRFLSELQIVPLGAIGTEEAEALERHERIEDFDAPPYPHQLEAWMERMDGLESESPEEFAAELRAFEERMEEWAPGPGLGEPGGMCSWVRLTVAAADARAARPDGDEGA